MFGETNEIERALDMKQRKKMQMIILPTTHLIEFKTKSEQERYTKLAFKLFCVKQMTTCESDLTYEHLFKFLLEIMDPDDFLVLTYKAINKLIHRVQNTRSNAKTVQELLTPE